MLIIGAFSFSKTSKLGFPAAFLQPQAVSLSCLLLVLKRTQGLGERQGWVMVNEGLPSPETSRQAVWPWLSRRSRNSLLHWRPKLSGLPLLRGGAGDCVSGMKLCSQLQPLSACTAGSPHPFSPKRGLVGVSRVQLSCTSPHF